MVINVLDISVNLDQQLNELVDRLLLNVRGVKKKLQKYNRFKKDLEEYRNLFQYQYHQQLQREKQRINCQDSSIIIQKPPKPQFYFKHMNIKVNNQSFFVLPNNLFQTYQVQNLYLRGKYFPIDSFNDFLRIQKVNFCKRHPLVYLQIIQQWSKMLSVSFIFGIWYIVMCLSRSLKSKSFESASLNLLFLFIRQLIFGVFTIPFIKKSQHSINNYLQKCIFQYKTGSENDSKILFSMKQNRCKRTAKGEVQLTILLKQDLIGNQQLYIQLFHKQTWEEYELLIDRKFISANQTLQTFQIIGIKRLYQYLEDHLKEILFDFNTGMVSFHLNIYIFSKDREISSTYCLQAKKKLTNELKLLKHRIIVNEETAQRQSKEWYMPWIGGLVLTTLIGCYSAYKFSNVWEKFDSQKELIIQVARRANIKGFSFK